MKRKLFLGLGTVASVAAPIVAVVSCGDEIIAGKMSYNRSDKEVVFNLNADAPDGAFEAYKLDKAGKGVLAAAHDFETIIGQNNVLKLQEGDVVTVKMKVQYVLNYKVDTIRGTLAGLPTSTKAEKATKKAGEDAVKDILADYKAKVKKDLVFKFKFHGKASGNFAKKDVFGELKTNFYESLLMGLKTIGLVKLHESYTAPELDKSGSSAAAPVTIKTPEAWGTEITTLAALKDNKAAIAIETVKNDEDITTAAGAETGGTTALLFKKALDDYSKAKNDTKVFDMASLSFK